MDCKITCSEKRQHRAGFTLIEVILASAIGLLIVAAIGAVSLYTSRSFAALSNYLDLDEHNQQALDRMSREFRQVHQLTAYQPNGLTFEDYDGQPLQYTYDPAARTLIRTKGRETTALLTGCDTLQFLIYQRTPISNKFEPYPTTSVANAKLVELRWNCSRDILGTKANTESMQSAIIVIRQK